MTLQIFKRLNYFKTCFFDAYSEDYLNCISQEFYETCALHNQIMYFVPCFITTNLPLYINVIEELRRMGVADIAKTTLAIATDVASTCERKPLKIFLIKSFPILIYKSLLLKKLVGLDLKPIDLLQDIVNGMNTYDFKNQSSFEFTKLRGGYPKKNSSYATKHSMHTYYYPRPTPQDVLIEERDWNQTNTSYSISQIYEWNLDGLADRQLTIMIHQMLMYATICKSVKNTDRVICKMIVAGFNGQLRGWWDDYLSGEKKTSIFNVVATDAGIDNLGMALVQNKEDTKDKFIDGLSPLFAERVRKTLRDSQGEIP
ncbi:hypothetical protein H5410_002668 [Solanum commersonii]|uniref:Uncharacterized protein n=1 Tax=Solanum commersonii TaxID=4109 RepID=A0A9J6B3I5_SOLCO|nr:hypothetical protein H5410_002668 [Solanum commersonii]